jgi:hypothetical protein
MGIVVPKQHNCQKKDQHYARSMKPFFIPKLGFIESAHRPPLLFETILQNP